MTIVPMTANEINESNPRYGVECMNCRIRFIRQNKVEFTDNELDLLDHYDMPRNCADFLCSECLESLDWLLSAGDWRKK